MLKISLEIIYLKKLGGNKIKGKVIRKIKGFYYVINLDTVTNIENLNNMENINRNNDNKYEIYECKLKGTLKVQNDKLNCIIGDIVQFDQNENIITKIEKRKNILQRPLISNVDYIGLLFSMKQPDFDLTVFQKMILHANAQNIPVLSIFSKSDLMEKSEIKSFVETIKRMFNDTFPIFVISSETGEGISELKEFLFDKSTTITGPSGVGKSTFINSIIGEEILETNDINVKTKRGKHTTTESRFFAIEYDKKGENSTFIIDTPGFSSLEYPFLKDKKQLDVLFKEFEKYIPFCKFRDCVHLNEPHCAIKENVENGNISSERYEFYLKAFYNIFDK